MRTHEIHEAFDLLRDLCDPRGHALLKALEQLCIMEALSLDAVLEQLQEVSQSSNVIPLLRDYSARA